MHSLFFLWATVSPTSYALFLPNIHHISSEMIPSVTLLSCASRRAGPYPTDSRRWQWTQVWLKRGAYLPGLSDCVKGGHIIQDHRRMNTRSCRLLRAILEAGYYNVVTETGRKSEENILMEVWWSQFSVTSWHSGGDDKLSSTSESWNSTIGFVNVEVIGVLSVGQCRWKLDLERG